MEPKDDNVFFSSDQPISSQEEDLLNRGELGKALAEQIAHWGGKECIVIGLCGPWGCGKTSLLNLTCSALPDATAGRPYIVRFNPWLCSSQQQLIGSLFTELADALPSGINKDGRAPVDTLLRYGSMLANAAPAFAAVAAAGGVDPTVVASISTGSKALTGIKNLWNGIFGKGKKPDIEALGTMKRNLHDSFEELDRQILVVIDDIDRLQPDEVRLIFRLIKANLDLPRIVFLLAFQRDTIEEMLSSKNFDGAEYLRKIVQIWYDVPNVSSERLGGMLFKRLDSVLGQELLQSRFFHLDRFHRIFGNGLSPYLKNLRDVNLYLNAVKFHLGYWQRGGSLEVNIVDLLAIEALRVFENQVFCEIRKSRDALIRSRDEFLPVDKGDIAENLRSLFDRASNKEAAQIVVQSLFPNSKWATEELADFVDFGLTYSPRWRDDYYIAHPRNFERYFSLSIPDTDISRTAVLDVLNKAVDAATLEVAISDLDARNLLDAFLARAIAELASVPSECHGTLVAALLNAGDCVASEGVRAQPRFSWQLAYRARDIIDEILEMTDTQLNRVRLMEQALANTQGLWLSIILVGREEVRHEDPAKHGEPFTSSDDLSRLKTACVRRIEALSKTDRFGEIEFLEQVLHRWSAWGSAEKAKLWAIGAIEDVNMLLAIPVGFLHSVDSSRGGIHTIHYYMRLEDIEKYFKPDELMARLGKIDPDTVTPHQRTAISTFQKALTLRGRRDGSYRRWIENGGDSN